MATCIIDLCQKTGDILNVQQEREINTAVDVHVVQRVTPGDTCYSPITVCWI